MVIYLLKINVVLMLLYGFYRLMYNRDTFFGWRRSVLIGIYLVSLLIPCDEHGILGAGTCYYREHGPYLCRSGFAYDYGHGSPACFLVDGRYPIYLFVRVALLLPVFVAVGHDILSCPYHFCKGS